MPDRPHIIIFNPDQWRGDVMGHLGNLAYAGVLSQLRERMLHWYQETCDVVPHQIDKR